MSSTNSRLLALPPEIRNKIYEILFKFPEGISFLSLADRKYLVNNKVDSDKPDSGLNQSVALLRTCRQLCSEAGGVLYGSNVFHLAHARSRYYDRNLNYNIHACARWLESIGRMVTLLRTVMVNIYEAARYNLAPWVVYNNCFDILPLVRLYWSDSNRDLHIHFIDSPGYLRIFGDTFRSRHTSFSIKVLHEVLHRLGREDVLHLKKSNSFLRSILIRWDGTYGHVCYRSMGPRSGFLRKFNILSGGSELRPFHPQRPSDLAKLPKHLLSRIVAEAVRPEYVEYDASSSKWLKHRVGLLEICKSLRQSWTEPVAQHCELKVSTHINSQSSHFHKAGPFSDATWLRDLKNDAREQSWEASYLQRISFEPSQAKNLAPPTVVLKLQTQNETSLSDITINATHLRQLKHFPSQTPITISLSPYQHNNIGYFLTTTDTTLGEVIRRSFLFLSDIYFSYPPWSFYHYNIAIYTNSHGTPVHVFLLDDGDGKQNVLMIPNHRIHATSIEVTSLTSERIRMLENDWIIARYKQEGKFWERDLVTMLGSLRDICAAYETCASTQHTQASPLQVSNDMIPSTDVDTHKHTSKPNTNIERVAFTANEFETVDWRDALCYRVRTKNRFPAKPTATSPSTALQQIPHYGCGGCTDSCIRGSVGSDELSQLSRGFRGLWLPETGDRRMER